MNVIEEIKPPPPRIDKDRLFFMGFHLFVALVGVFAFDFPGCLAVIFVNGLMLGFHIYMAISRWHYVTAWIKEHKILLGLRRMVETPVFSQEGHIMTFQWYFPTPAVNQMMEDFEKERNEKNGTDENQAQA